MKNLIIIGAGGGSQSISVEARETWNVQGFLDDNLVGQEVLGLPVLGPLDAVHDFDDAYFVIGVANHRVRDLRRTIFERLGLPIDRYGTVIHLSSVISPAASIGAGTVIKGMAVVENGVRTGNHVHISPHCLIGAESEIEDGVMMAGGTIFAGGNRVGSGTYLGNRVLLAEGVEIGQGATIGMAAVIEEDVPDGAVMVGNPARRIR